MTAKQTAHPQAQQQADRQMHTLEMRSASPKASQAKKMLLHTGEKRKKAAKLPRCLSVAQSL
jgi:hypothetical protein